MAQLIPCTCRVTGSGAGPILITSQPVSFWGGVNPEHGGICDPRHELYGHSIAGKVLVFPFGKGSAAAPMVFLELCRTNKHPAALVLLEIDPLLVSGPILSKHVYNKVIPVVTLSPENFRLLEKGTKGTVDSLNTGSMIQFTS